MGTPETALPTENRPASEGAPARPSGLKNNLRWFIIGIPLFLAWAIANTDKLGVGVIAADQSFLQHFDIVGKHAAIGLLITAFAIPYALTNFLWGIAIDRIGPRWCATVSGLLWTLMMASAALINSYELLLVSRIVLGAAEGSMWAVSAKLVGSWFPARERARAQGFYGYGQVAGPAAGAVLVTSIISATSWQVSFMSLAGLSFLFTVPLFVFVIRNTPEEHPRVGAIERRYITSQQGPDTDAIGTSSGQAPVLGRIFRSGRFWLTTVAFLGTSVSFYGLATWVPSYLIQQRGFSAGVMATWLSVGFLIAVAMTAVGTFVADLTRRPSLIAVIANVVSAAILLIGVTSSSPQVAAPLIAFGQGVSFMSTSLAVTVLQRYFTRGALGRASGAMSGIGNMIGGTSATWLGWMIDLGGGSYVMPIAAIAVCLFAGATAFGILSRDDSGRGGRVKARQIA